LAEEAEPQLMLSDVRRWQQRLRREEENIRAALRWAIAQGEADIGLRIAGALWRYWLYWAHLREARQWLESVMTLPGGAEPTTSRAKALAALAGVLYWQGQGERLANSTTRHSPSTGSTATMASLVKRSSMRPGEPSAGARYHAPPSSGKKRSSTSAERATSRPRRRSKPG
jgi:hypothetical protein